MKISPLFVWSLAVSLLALTSLTGAAEPARLGTLKGYVYNPATGGSLKGVAVKVPALNREAMTEDSGVFVMPDLPEGEHQVTVQAMGYESRSVRATVAPGAVAEIEVALSLRQTGPGAKFDPVVKLQALTVVETREMSAQALALNEQRNSVNYKNVVALDEFGDRGGENIGNFLMFLPGVSILSASTEADGVSIRGLPSNTTGMMIDGESIASSSDARAPTLRAVPMSNISRVEVTKVPTPDMPANGLGGSINLISKVGFDTKTPQFAYKLYGIFHDSNGLTAQAGPRAHLPQGTADYKRPSFDFNYSHPVNRNLAFTVGGAYTWKFRPLLSGNDETAQWDLISLVQRSTQWTSLAQLWKTISGQVGVDWRMGEKDTLKLSVHTRTWNTPITRSQLALTYGAGATGDSRYTQGAATAVGSVAQANNWRFDEWVTHAGSLRYRHDGRQWNLEAGLSWSEAGNTSSDLDAGTFNSGTVTMSNLILRGESPANPRGFIHESYSARSRTGQPVNIYDGGEYVIQSVTSQQNRRMGHLTRARADLTRDLDGALAIKLRGGVAVERNTNDYRGGTITWNFRPNGSTDAAVRAAKNFDVFDEEFLKTAPTVFGVPYRELSLKKLYNLAQANPGWFVLDDAAAHQARVNNSREYEETISAAYFRSDAKFFDSKLWIAAGVRMEHTANEGRGPLDDINNQYLRDASGKFVLNAAGQRILRTTDALEQRRLRFQERQARTTRSYQDFYPSINASYNLTENLVLRSAYARTIGRPDLNFITPGVTITAPEVSNPSITVSNTALKPWTADNFDLTIEAFGLKGGTGSFSVFRKEIKNFFGVRTMEATTENLSRFGVEDDGSYRNYSIITRDNIGDASVSGYEVGYRQSLNFLPHWARGFQVFATMTNLSLGGSNSADFTGFTPRTYTGGINFIRARLAVKTTINYQGETRRALAAPNLASGIPENTYNYQGKLNRINLNAEYAFTKRLSTYCSVSDIGGFDLKDLRFAPNTPEYAKGVRIQRFGTFFSLGIKGTY